MYKNNFAKKLGILTFTPDHRETLWIVAHEFAKRNEYQRAVNHFYRFLNASSKDAKGLEWEQSFQAHLMIADIHLRLNEPQKALTILNAAKLYFPDRGEVYWLLALTYWQTGNEQQAADAMTEGKKNVREFDKYLLLFETLRKKKIVPQKSR